MLFTHLKYGLESRTLIYRSTLFVLSFRSKSHVYGLCAVTLSVAKGPVKLHPNNYSPLIHTVLSIPVSTLVCVSRDGTSESL